MTRSLVHLGPLAVDHTTSAQALARITSIVDAGEGGYVVTPNVDHIVLASNVLRLRFAYHEASLSLADGQPLLWMAKLLGTPIPEKISGSDLIWALMELAAEKDWGVFLYGASDAVSLRATEVLEARFPSLRIVGRDTSFWSGGDSPELVERIRASGAQIVIVGLGCPKQEDWMFQHAARIAPAVAFGLGGSLDFVAGNVPRAPRWMSRAGLEWSYRLLREPRRLAHRYLVRDSKIAPLFLRMIVDRLRVSRRTRPVRLPSVST